MNDYDSGPFCQHWCDPSDCDTKCNCGHTCGQHNWYGDDCDICNCDQFDDEE